MRTIHVYVLSLILVFLGCQSPRIDPPDTSVHLFLANASPVGPGVTKVLVTLAGVDVYSENQGAWGPVLDYAPSGRTIDLLELQGGQDQEIGAFSLPPGTYDRLLFLLSPHNQIEVDEGAGPRLLPLETAAGMQDPVVQHTFTVTGTSPTKLVVDFDASRSVYGGGAEWRLEPVLRMDSTYSDSVVTKVVGPAGGTILLPYKAQVDIPPGALASETDVSIAAVKLPPDKAAEQGVMPSSVVELGPAGQQFAAPVQVTVWFDPVEQRGRPPSDLAFLSRERGHGWVRQPGTWNTRRGTCSGTLTHLGIVATGSDIERIDPPALGGVIDPGPRREVEVTYWDHPSEPKSPLSGVETNWASSHSSLEVGVPARHCADRSEPDCTRDAGCYFMSPECIDDRRLASFRPVRYPGGTITITPGHPSLTAGERVAIRGLRVRFHDFIVLDDSDFFGAGALYWQFRVDDVVVVNQPDWQHHGTGDTVPLLDQTSFLMPLASDETFRLHVFFGEDDSWEIGGGGSDEAWFDRTYGWANVGELPRTTTDTNNGEGTLGVYLNAYLEPVPP